VNCGLSSVFVSIKSLLFQGGVNRCPNLSTNLDTSRFSRPERVQPLRVSAVFREVILSGHVREMIQVETTPLWTKSSPTTFTCMLICIRAWPASSGCPSTGFSPTTCSRRGRAGARRKDKALSRLLKQAEEEPWLCAAANAIHDKTSDAHWLRR
jgi:hypothetical protein